MSNSFAIIVICYNRPSSLRRLLDSLCKIDTGNDEVTLYISIDNAKKYDISNEEVKDVARSFAWPFGKKIVDIKAENMGLKKHVLACGNLTERFENIIVLEDDLIVSPVIYKYAKQVVDFYKNDERIAGYGLYLYPKNQYSNKLFFPLNDCSNVFFMQNPCSWGQIWTKDKWRDFYKWYLDNCNDDYFDDAIPSAVCRWDDKSWLKWHIKYVIEKNKFFVYPNFSITTNFSEKGVHNSNGNNEYQSLLCFSKLDDDFNFNFVSLDSSHSIYDAFYENIHLDCFCNLDDLVCSDYNSLKPIEYVKKNYRYLLSTNCYNYKIIKKYGLEMYPYEQNIINCINGDDLFLYDLTEKTNNINNNSIKSVLYSYRMTYFTFKELLFLKKWINLNILKRFLLKMKCLVKKND